TVLNVPSKGAVFDLRRGGLGASRFGRIARAGPGGGGGEVCYRQTYDGKGVLLARGGGSIATNQAPALAREGGCMARALVDRPAASTRPRDARSTATRRRCRCAKTTCRCI